MTNYYAVLVDLEHSGGSGTAAIDPAAKKSCERNASNLISFITDRATRSVTTRKSVVVQLVKSLVTVFVARRSGQDEWFNNKELDRCIRSFEKTASVIEQCSSDDNQEQTLIKYYQDLYVCKVFGDIEGERLLMTTAKPEVVKNNPPLFVGWLKRCIMHRLARSDYRFFYSLQKGAKKMWPSLGKVKELAAYQKHADRLSSFHGTCDADLASAIRLTSKEIFQKVEKRGTKLMPSLSACLQASRREGGVSSLFKPMRVSNKGEGIGALRQLDHDLSKWRSATFREAFDTAAGTGEREFVPNCDVNVTALPEPGKFRVLSLGDGYLYTALQPLQGQMLSAWKHHRTSTMLYQDLTARVQEIAEQTPETWKWFSVDYEAATDLLKRDATHTAFDAIPVNFWDSKFGVNVEEIRLGRASLASGIAHYPEWTGIKPVFAKDGQLMGHPLSFPLLCTINLAVYRCALWRYFGSTSPEVRQYWDAVIVNGDDMLFRMPEDFYPVFLEVSKNAGFKISDGKNYISDRACMINSQVFSTKSDGSIRKEGYLNLKLIQGSSLKGGTSAALPTQLGPEISKMIRDCPWAGCMLPEMFSRFSKESAKHGFRPNWYLPVHLGGYGVSADYAPKTLKITREQRQIASAFVNKPELALYRKLGFVIKTKGYEKALNNFRMMPVSLHHVPSSDESFEQDDKWLERLAYVTQATRMGKPASDRVILSQIKRDHRLKPMSVATMLDKYWSIRFVGKSSLPVCPPLNNLYTIEPRVLLPKDIPLPLDDGCWCEDTECLC